MTASHIDFFTIDDNGQFQLARAEQVIEAALTILHETVIRNDLISAPADVGNYFSLRLGKTWSMRCSRPSSWTHRTTSSNTPNCYGAR